MVETNEQNENKEETTENEEDITIGQIITWTIYGFFGFLIFRSCGYSNTSSISQSRNNYDVKIINQYKCGDYNYPRICGIVQNNEKTDVTASIKVDYYDSANIKVGNDINLITIDARGKSKFETSGFTDSYSTYKVYIDGIYPK